MKPPRHLLFGYAQDRGERAYQEDAIGFRTLPLDAGRETPSLMVLADGMGGHTGGKIAAETAIRTFLETYDEDAAGQPGDKLDAALDAANSAIAASVAENQELQGMGCTLVAIAFTEAGGHWISVGDSPMWLYSGKGLARLNADHSMSSVLSQLVADGRMTAQEAAVDPRRSALRSALTGAEIAMVDRSPVPLVLAPGDCLVMASDGLDTIEEARLGELLAEPGETAQGLAEALVAETLAAGQPGQDNVSVVIVRAPGASCVRRSDLSTATLPRNEAPTHQRAPLERAGDAHSGQKHLATRRIVPIALLVVVIGLAWLAASWVQAIRTASEPAGPIGPGTISPDEPPQQDGPEADPSPEAPSETGTAPRREAPSSRDPDADANEGDEDG